MPINHTEPLPIIRSPFSLRNMFDSLKSLQFRTYSIYLLLAVTGVWIQRLAQDWLVLEKTGELALVGLTVSLQFGPTLLFGAFAGVIADRFNPKRVLMITASCSIISALTLAILNATGQLEVIHIYGVALLYGITSTIDNPTRWVLVNKLLSRGNIKNAISVKSTIFEFSGLAGPFISGFLIWFIGTTWSLTTAGLFGIIALCLLASIRDVPATTSTEKPLNVFSSLVEGLRYANRKPVLIWTFLLCLLYSIFFWPMSAIFLDYASRVFDIGSLGYGLITAALGFGATVGALLSTRIHRFGLRYLFLVTLLAALSHILAAALQDFTLFLIGTIVMGIVHILFVTAANATVQSHSNSQMRGRAMALYYMFVNGGMVIGAPMAGVLAGIYGGAFVLFLTGLLPLIILGIGLGIYALGMIFRKLKR